MYDYIIYLNLFEFIWMIMNEVVSVFLYGSIFWFIFFHNHKISFKFSLILTNYLGLSFFSSLFTCIHAMYMVTFWRNPPNYNAYVMFFTGWLDNSILPSVSAGLVFIMLERCYIIKFPTQYGVDKQRGLFIVSFIICSLILIVNGTFLMLEIPQTSDTDCIVFVCLCKFYKRFVYWVLRNTLAVLNVVMGLLFFYYLKYGNRSSENENTKKNHNLVLRTVIATIMLDLIPASISFLLPYLVPIDINSLAGPYVRLITSFDSLYTALIHYRIIRKHTSNIKVVTHSSKLRKMNNNLGHPN